MRVLHKVVVPGVSTLFPDITPLSSSSLPKPRVHKKIKTRKRSDSAPEERGDNRDYAEDTDEGYEEGEGDDGNGDA